MARPDTYFLLTDADTGLRQSVSVSYPYRYGSLETVPVVICLDEPWMFGTVVDTTRIMSMGSEAPEAVVVGLGFGAPADGSTPPSAGPNGLPMSECLRERARWYTPTPWVPPELTGVKHMAAEEAGRADQLRSFIEAMLLPRLVAEELGDTTIGDRWFVGHSFGGLFGLKALFAEPALFDRWLLASPSIWWDDRAILGWEADYAAANDDLPARVFLSYGGEEDTAPTGDPTADQFRMGANVRDLHATLEGRSYPGLDLTLARLDGHSHNSVIGSAVAQGFRSLI